VSQPLPPGSFYLTRIGGLVGLLISLGQWIIGDASRFTHAGIVLDDGTVLEAMPSGARIAPLQTVTSGRHLAVSWAIPLDELLRRRIVIEARHLEGTRYGFTAYLHLALTRFGIRWGWLVRRLHCNGRLICSQLVDEAYHRAGVQLFTDGRARFEVTPGDLANLLIERDWQALGIRRPS
jgi:cell wall-associated NlpC family hydrolase